jgi:hypothetical protein
MAGLAARQADRVGFPYIPLRRGEQSIRKSWFLLSSHARGMFLAAPTIEATPAARGWTHGQAPFANKRKSRPS